MKFYGISVLWCFLAFVAGCNKHSAPNSQSLNEVAPPSSKHTVIVTSPAVKDITSYQSFVCQIHSRRHIDVHALESGYLESIEVKEGQAVKKNDVMFRIFSKLKKAKLDAVIADAHTAQIGFENTQKLVAKGVVSDQQLRLAQATLDNANAKVELARTELSLTEVKAAFDGMIDRQDAQLGSLINEGDVLTSLSDNTVMWVYFNVPEAKYLDYQKTPNFAKEMTLQLVLANHETFDEPGKIGAIETVFDNKTGNIALRADFPNPKNVLRHGQTGTVRIPRVLNDALLIPQRATYNVLNRRYVWAIESDIIKQREIFVEEEMEDVFVIEKGLSKEDKFVLDGIRQVRDGDKLTYQYVKPDEVLSRLKNSAE